jgi:hypothetical protein
LVYRTKKGTMRCIWHGAWHYDQVNRLGKRGCTGPKTKAGIAKVTQNLPPGGPKPNSGPKTAEGKEKVSLNLRKTPNWKKHLARVKAEREQNNRALLDLLFTKRPPKRESDLGELLRRARDRTTT